MCQQAHNLTNFPCLCLRHFTRLDNTEKAILDHPGSCLQLTLLVLYNLDLGIVMAWRKIVLVSVQCLLVFDIQLKDLMTTHF